MKRMLTEEQKIHKAETHRIWMMNNKERYKEKRHKYYLKNKSIVIARAKAWAERNPDYHREHYHKNKERICLEQKSYREIHKNDPFYIERKKAWSRKYTSTHREELREKSRVNNARDYEKLKPYRKIWQRNNYHKNLKKNPQYIIRLRLAQRVRLAFRKGHARKTVKLIELMGCQLPDFIKYFESKFTPGMTWKNIHIDHIRPCASFDLTDLEQQKQCFHYTNLQPLFAADNRRKGSFWNGERIRRAA